MVPPIALERPALSAELQKHQFMFATETKRPISRVSASVVIWEHLSASDAVQIVLKNSVTEMPNRLLKIACEEAIAKRQFRWHKAIRIIVISISQQGPGLSSNYSLSTSNPPTSTNLSLGPWQAYHTSRLKYQITWCGQHWLLL